MATNPPMAADPSADPSAAAPEAETDDGGYIIQIKVDGQGQISVGVENESGEAPESAEGPEGDEGAPADPAEDEDSEMSAFTPAKDIKDALTQALQIYRDNGKASSKAADDDFNKGYGS